MYVYIYIWSPLDQKLPLAWFAGPYRKTEPLVLVVYSALRGARQEYAIMAALRYVNRCWRKNHLCVGQDGAGLT